MPQWRTGSVVESQRLTDSLAVFTLMPEPGTGFPGYDAGQYIALRRDHCRLTRLVVEASGRQHAVPQLAADRRPALGPVSHPYSIASAPYEAAAQNRLEFFITRELDPEGVPGRFSSSLFEMEATGDHTLSYFRHMSGTFTLAERAQKATSVLMVGTGTGIAPFVSMIKQLDHDARTGRTSDVRYTLIYAHRTDGELAYHSAFLDIESAHRFDFLYIPSISRPADAQGANTKLGRGRANNLLRHILGMPVVADALGHAIQPALPAHLSRENVAARFCAADTVLLTCGNPLSVEDLRRVAHAKRIRFETEDW